MTAPRFDKPVAVDGVHTAFGGDMKKLLPPWPTIPEQFKRSSGTPFNRVVSQWFFGGLPPDTEFTPKEGIDAKVALRHVAAVLRSFEPKHEHKEAGAAYLLSLWFDSIELPKEAA